MIKELKKFAKLQDEHANALKEYQNHISNLSDEEKQKYNFYLREKDRLAKRRQDKPDLAALFMGEDEKNLMLNPPNKFVHLYKERNDLKLQLAKIKMNFVHNLIPQIIDGIKNGELKLFPFEVQTYCKMDYDANFGGLARASIKFSSDEFGNLDFEYDVENGEETELEDILILTKMLRPFLPKIKEFALAATEFDARFDLG